MKNYDLLSENDREEIEKQESDKQKSSKTAKIIINVSETQYAVIKSVAKKKKWALTSEPIINMNFDLCWTDNHVKQQIFYKMQQHQKINHFPGMGILSRKNNLGKSLMQFKHFFNEEYDFFPLTWNLPNDFTDLKQYHDNRQAGRAQTFIVKPEASCQGRGIFLTRNIEKLKAERCVVQRYLHKPFLIEGLKFDLRIYVLLAGIDPFRIFVYQEGLARLATEEYCPPRSDNLQNKFMHLTNYAINKLHPNFIFNESATETDIGHKRSLSSVYKLIGEMGHDVKALKQRINDIIIKTIITGYPTLSRMQQSIHPQNLSNDMCFEVLGFDVMLDHELTPYLLEINYTPSFTTDTPLDKNIKKQLILDTLQLINLTEERKMQIKQNRDEEIHARMLSGKRKKYTLEEKQSFIRLYAQERNLYEASHLGNYTKIFVNTSEQFQHYRRYYQFAEQLYAENNKLFPPTGANYFPFYVPFIKSQKEPTKKKRGNSIVNAEINQDNKKDRYQQGFSHNKRQIQSAKSNKRTIMSSSKHFLEEKKQMIQDIYFEPEEVPFKNKNLKKALNKAKSRKAMNSSLEKQ